MTTLGGRPVGSRHMQQSIVYVYVCVLHTPLLESLKQAIGKCAAVVYFELPVGAFVVLYPGFEFFDRCDACPLKDPIAFGSDTLETREGCGLKQFEMFADPL